MKYNQICSFCILLIVGLLCNSCTETTPSDTKELLTRSWGGDQFFLVTVNDSTRRFRDMVAILDFRNDGSYLFLKHTMSHPAEVGEWSLEDGETKIKLSLTADYSEIYDITELTSSLFIMGDTNSRGFKLFPIDQ